MGELRCQQRIFLGWLSRPAQIHRTDQQIRQRRFADVHRLHQLRFRFGPQERSGTHWQLHSSHQRAALRLHAPALHPGGSLLPQRRQLAGRQRAELRRRQLPCALRRLGILRRRGLPVLKLIMTTGVFMKHITRNTLGATLALLSPALWAATAPVTPVTPKVMLVAMFAPEAQNWIDRLHLTKEIQVPGLAAEYPAIRCNAQDVCLMVTGMGQTNAAASTLALALSPQFDLRKTYFIVAGIAGINPHHGTLGTTAWAHYLVEFGTQWEIDSRDVPKDWPTGYLGINTKGPNEKPPLDYKTEVFELNPKLQAKAFALSQKVTLSESKESAAWRVKYPYAPANQPPQVTQCDTLAGNTWFSGTRLSERAEVWTKLLTDGKGVYCTTQQEDNSTYEALLRASKAGKVDVNRLAVVRAGSDFDRPYPGYSEVDNLLKYADQGAFVPALENLYRTGNPLVQAIVGDWKNWEKGVPQ
ncbi:Purine nucleoside permease [Pseudomonas savastanoi pv. nerii]|nr:Purine nucleoside permease [Pseudomonas savastanoi pv. nerii]